jgi:hypothetical protein
MRERYKTGILWHSYCAGTPEFEEWLPSVAQPYAVIFAGVVLVLLKIYAPGILLIVSGFISVQVRHIAATRFYHKVLDVVDARIEQEQLADAVLKQSNPSATSGFVAPLPAYVSRKHREKFLQGMGVAAAALAA